MQTARTFRPPCPRLCGDTVKRGVIALLLPNLLTALLISSLFFLALPVSTHAQIVRDSSLGAMKNQPLVGPNFAITSDLGEIHGPNLFHSFSEFNLRTIGATIESATFSGPATIGNILTRVSGTNPSSINGLIRSDIQGAQLFFFNPNGVVFGPNASFNVSGSVAFSTANYLRLVDGAKFYASLSSTSTLTSAPIAAFGFLGPTVAPITFQGTILEIPEGQTLSVVGGDISMTGATIIAPSSRVNLASAASAGELVFSTIPGAPPIEMQGFTTQGRISITQGSGIDASGGSGPGRVTIRAGRVLVDESFVASDNIGDADAAGLGIDIGAVELISLTNGAAVTAAVGGAGRSGGIAIRTANLDVANGSVVLASTFAAGDAGLITVDATESISLHRDGAPGSSTGFFSDALGSGNAGSLIVATPSLTANGGRIRALTAGSGNGGSVSLIVDQLTLTGGVRVDTGAVGGSSGQAGSVTVTATGSVSITGSGSGLFSDTSGKGTGGHLFVSAPTLAVEGGRISALTRGGADAGVIDLEIGRLTLRGGAQIITDAAPGSTGQGGTVTIAAGEAVTISGQDSAGNFSGLFASAGGSKAGGHVMVSAPVIDIDGGLIQAGTTGKGDAGEVQVNAGQLTLTHGGQINSGATTGSSGRAGSVTVTATDVVSLDGVGSGLFSNTSGSGAAGTITIGARRLSMQGGAEMATGTFGSGAGGTVTVIATEEVLVSGFGTGAGGTVTRTAISSDALQGSSGPGGRVLISAPAVSLLDTGKVEAATAGTGRAGQISIEAGRLLVADGGEISVGTTGAGRGGTLTVTATESIMISGGSPQGRSGIFALAQEESQGDAGDISITTPILTMQGGLIQALTAGAGGGGDIILMVDQLSLAGGAQISATTFGTGPGGAITVHATGLVQISGNDPGPAGIEITSGIFSRTETNGGPGGSLEVSAGDIQLTNGGTIATTSLGPGGAGNIHLQAGNQFASDGGFVGSAAVQSKGGDVTIAAGQSIQLSNGAKVTAEGFGAGNAGDILLSSGNQILLSQSTVTSQATQASGGNITLTAPYLIHLINSTVSTSVQGGVQTIGGNIIIDPQFLILQNSQIIAQAFQGQGGNITIVAGVFLADYTSLVDASSQFGLSGTVRIQSPISNLAGTLAPLKQNYRSAAALLRERCATRIQSGKASSFTSRGRDGLPAAPGGLRPSPPTQLPPAQGPAGAVSPSGGFQLAPSSPLLVVSEGLMRPIGSKPRENLDQSGYFGACGS